MTRLRLQLQPQHVHCRYGKLGARAPVLRMVFYDQALCAITPLVWYYYSPLQVLQAARARASQAYGVVRSDFICHDHTRCRYGKLRERARLYYL